MEIWRKGRLTSISVFTVQPQIKFCMHPRHPENLSKANDPNPASHTPTHCTLPQFLSRHFASPYQSDKGPACSQSRIVKGTRYATFSELPGSRANKADRSTPRFLFVDKTVAPRRRRAATHRSSGGGSNTYSYRSSVAVRRRRPRVPVFRKNGSEIMWRTGQRGGRSQARCTMGYGRGVAWARGRGSEWGRKEKTGDS